MWRCWLHPRRCCLNADARTPRQGGYDRGASVRINSYTKRTRGNSTYMRDLSRAWWKPTGLPAQYPASNTLQHGILPKLPRERVWWFPSQETALASESTSHSEHLLISQNQRQEFRKGSVLSPPARASVTWDPNGCPFLVSRLDPVQEAWLNAGF